MVFQLALRTLRPLLAILPHPRCILRLQLHICCPQIRGHDPRIHAFRCGAMDARTRAQDYARLSGAESAS